MPCYQQRQEACRRKRLPRAAFGLPESAFVFCCFNGTHKINRFTFERWMEIPRVPESVLWPPRAASGDAGACCARSRAREALRPSGSSSRRSFSTPIISPGTRTPIFSSTRSPTTHTTASDAQWMGVPVLTLSGRSFASRVGGSLAKSAGLPELVTTRPEDYVARAIELAGSGRRELAELRARLRAGRETCSLFDTNLFVARLEATYRTMCREYQKGQLPKPDLANLSRYLAVGVGIDHEERELLAVADYHGIYAGKLSRLHRARPMSADGRLWTAEAVARAEKETKR
ncbi:MAG: hypothetical protein U1E87_06695 [Alphaproteobacteria bacterium]